MVDLAFAQTGPGAGGASGLISFAPLILVFVVFYFLLIRPQQKKAKQHKEMLTALRRGDRIVTSGGIIGTITKVASDTELVVEIAEGVRVRLVRGMISEVLAKTEPAKDKDDAPAQDKAAS